MVPTGTDGAVAAAVVTVLEREVTDADGAVADPPTVNSKIGECSTAPDRRDHALRR